MFLCPTPLSIIAPSFLCCLLHGIKLLNCLCALICFPSLPPSQLPCLLHGIKLLNCLCALICYPPLPPSQLSVPCVCLVLVRFNRYLAPVPIFVFVPCMCLVLVYFNQCLALLAIFEFVPCLCLVLVRIPSLSCSASPSSASYVSLAYICESGLNWTF